MSRAADAAIELAHELAEFNAIKTAIFNGYSINLRAPEVANIINIKNTDAAKYTRLKDFLKSDPAFSSALFYEVNNSFYGYSAPEVGSNFFPSALLVEFAGEDIILKSAAEVFSAGSMFPSSLKSVLNSFPKFLNKEVAPRFGHEKFSDFKEFLKQAKTLDHPLVKAISIRELHEYNGSTCHDFHEDNILKQIKLLKASGVDMNELATKPLTEDGLTVTHFAAMLVGAKAAKYLASHADGHDFTIDGKTLGAMVGTLHAKLGDYSHITPDDIEQVNAGDLPFDDSRIELPLAHLDVVPDHGAAAGGGGGEGGAYYATDLAGDHGASGADHL